MSKYMSRIKRANSKIEQLLGRAMWHSGLRYRKQYAVEGRPDFAFPALKVAVFCDSNFWHGFGWDTANKPIFRKNREFWESKIKRNIERDQIVNRELKCKGWVVIRLWEHEILNDTDTWVNKIRKVVAECGEQPSGSLK